MLLSYLIRRIAISIVVLLGIASVTFLMIHLIPGDPVREILGAHATPETIARLRHRLGLDRSLGEQFAVFLKNTVTGDLGTSITFNAPASETIASRMEPTVILVAYGMLIAIVLGVPLAIVAAIRQGGVLDNAIRLVTTFSFAMPTFWLGLMFALVVAYGLGLFPVSGYQPGLGGALRSMTLPALTLGLSLLVMVVRNLRSSLVEVLNSDYVEAARMRGFSESRVIVKHALRNSVIGTITVLGSLFGLVIGVMLFAEAVFQIPGAGTLLIQAVQKRDYQLVQALALLSGVVVVVFGVAMDILHAVIDPRIRLAGRNE
jgi:ABC-type dipeptide/oligopeptide/nickel transport system permease component